MKRLTRVVLRAGEPTFNGHVYPEAVLREAVEKAQERVKARRMLGNSNVNSPLVLEAVSHVVTDLRMESGAMVADVEFLDTPKGLEAQALLDAVGQIRARVRLSPTGRGTTTPMGVVESYELESVVVEFEPEREATGSRGAARQLGEAVSRIRSRRCPTHDSPCSCCQAHWAALDEEVGDAVVAAALEGALDPLAEMAAARGGLVEMEQAVRLVEAIIARTLADHPTGGERMVAELMTKGMKICRDALTKRAEAIKYEIQELESA